MFPRFSKVLIFEMFSDVYSNYKSSFHKTLQDLQDPFYHGFTQGDHGEHGEHGTEHTEHGEHSSGRSPWMLRGETHVEGDSWQRLLRFEPF